MTAEMSREDVDRLPGLVLVEFGASWCPHCQAIQPDLQRLLGEHPEIRHIKIEDGPGRPLGRSFRVKLWPTLVLLRDGVVVWQLVRPSAAEIHDAIASLPK